ncbi:MAG: [NiFe]-hydrogenase assembly chaperone HybE [Candidatus Competibacteraceae bacterium]
MTDQPATKAEQPCRLEAFFTEVQRTRMRGLPILHPAIQVEAVGFQHWDGGWLGVMVTPWFMSLLWLPDEPDIPLGQPGDKVVRSLPGGDYEFIVSHEEGLGPYLSCSLCSPMDAFPEHESARATAVAVMEAVLQPPAAPETGAVQPTEPPSSRWFSRRSLLLGRFSTDKT